MRSRLGMGELLLGLVVILGIIGTISFFAFEEYLGEYQAAFMIGSSLAFIASFFALSVYARAKKRAHFRPIRLDQAVGHWHAFAEAPEPPPGPQSPLPPGALASLAFHTFVSEGYRLAPETTPNSNDLVRFTSKTGESILVQCRQDTQEVGLREVVSFYERLRAEKAPSGEIWALGGFAPEAITWVSRKPIVLRDGANIHDIVVNLY